MLNHILVPLDGSLLAESALPHAVALARAFNAQLSLVHLLSGGDNTTKRGSIIDPIEWELGRAEAAAYLTTIAKRLEETGLAIDTALLEARSAQRFLDYVRGRSDSLIVLSSHGENGLTGCNISGVAHEILMRAHISTLLVPAYQQPAGISASLSYRRLMVPLDGSQRAEYALRSASTLARSCGAQLLLAHVVHQPELLHRWPLDKFELGLAQQLTERNSRTAAAYLEQIRARLDSDVRTHITVSDEVAIRLHDLVEEERVDLVVMSAHGFSSRTKWPFGSVAASFIHYGSVPLLVLQDLAPDQVEKTRAELAVQEYAGH